MLSYEHRPGPDTDPLPARATAPALSPGSALLRDLGNAHVQRLAESADVDDCGCGCGGQCATGGAG